MFTLTLVLAILTAMLRGGKLINLGDLRLKGWPLIFLSFGIQGALMSYSHNPFLGQHSFFLHIGSYLLLFVVFFLNWRQPGLLYMAAGTFLNFLVIAANGGRMPVSKEALLTAGQRGLLDFLRQDTSLDHVLLNESTRLPLLGDILALPEFFPRAAAFSLGDAFMMVGIVILVHSYLVNGRRQK